MTSTIAPPRTLPSRPHRAMSAGAARLGALLALVLATMAPAAADVLRSVEVLREGGCGGRQPAAPALHHVASLDRVAEHWSWGRSLEQAAAQVDYAGDVASGLHVRTSPAASPAVLLKVLAGDGCRTLADRALAEIGVWQHAGDTWLVLARPRSLPRRYQAPILAGRVLELVNEARSRGTRCGTHVFGPAPPVSASPTLDGVALGHADDMAVHGYFEHQDLAGHSPADRVRASGYREKLVGENIAYGPKSAEEVVQGWLDSPGHCENIMDPRFAEMGIAFASGRAGRHGLYWVQLLAAPRA